MLKGPLSTRASLPLSGLPQELRTLPEGGCTPVRFAVFCCVASPGLRSAAPSKADFLGGSPEIGSQFRRRKQVDSREKYVFRNV